MHSVHCMEVVFHHIIIQYTQYPSEGGGGGGGGGGGWHKRLRSSLLSARSVRM